jgi:hypothetical protein
VKDGVGIGRMLFQFLDAEIGTVTAWRWMKDPSFAAQYREATAGRALVFK